MIKMDNFGGHFFERFMIYNSLKIGVSQWIDSSAHHHGPAGEGYRCVHCVAGDQLRFANGPRELHPPHWAVGAVREKGSGDQLCGR